MLGVPHEQLSAQCFLFLILLSSPQEPPKMRGVKVVRGLKVVRFTPWWANVHEAMIAFQNEKGIIKKIERHPLFVPTSDSFLLHLIFKLLY